jgi:hypothetical protein
MHEDAAQNTPPRRFVMYPKFDFIRRFVQEASQVARLLAFDVDVEFDITEEEIVEDFEVRGYGIFAGR